MNPAEYLIVQIANVVDFLLMLYEFGLFFYVILTWLLIFRVIKQPFRPLPGCKQMSWQRISTFLQRVYEPALRIIRRYIPVKWNIDWSVIVLFIGIGFIRYTLAYVVGMLILA